MLHLRVSRHLQRIGTPGRSFAVFFALFVALTPVVTASFLAGPSSAVAATLEVAPNFMYLGSFSTLEPIDNQLLPGRTTISILSDQDWRLELRLVGPIRLTGSTLTLPLARALETHPYLPAGFLNLQPYIAMSGRGSAEPQEFAHDWLELQSLLQEYLTQGDPAGTYELTLFGRLLDGTGAPLTDQATLTVQFDVAPWVDILDPIIPDFRVALSNGATEAESEIVPVTLRSNAEWQLSVSAQGRFLKEGGAIEYELNTLSACTEDFGGVSRGCIPLSEESAVLAEGSAPPPFTVGTIDVPVKFRFLTNSVISVGQYGVTVFFTARAVARPP